jgi:hypothetical protein
MSQRQFARKAAAQQQSRVIHRPGLIVPSTAPPAQAGFRGAGLGTGIAWGVIFDIDGTLIDSVGAHGRAWQVVYARYVRQVAFEEIRHQIGKGVNSRRRGGRGDRHRRDGHVGGEEVI